MALRVMWALAACAAFCCATNPQESPDRDHAQQQALVDLEKRWLSAEEDPKLLEGILADEFVHVLPFGFVTKAEQLQDMRSHPSTQPRSSRHFEDLRVRIYGSAGIVNGIVVAIMPEGTVKKTIFTDVFVYRDGKWRAVNAQELPLNE